MDVKMDVNRSFDGFPNPKLDRGKRKKRLVLLGFLVVSAEGLEPSTP
jgi:hypothetical protein